MTDPGAALRARVGAALRAQPSELDRRPRATVVAGDADPAAAAEAAAMARQLEADAPGLALMLQLRSRFFDRAARDACRRGLRRLVAVACGLDDRRLAAAASAGGVRVVDVDTPEVLSLKRAPGAGVRRLAASDLGAATWLRGESATFYLVQNAAFWLAGRTVGELLGQVAVEAPAGSEVLLNCFLGDRDRVPMATLARLGLRMDDPMPTRGVARALEAMGLEPVAVFDSCELQRCYLDCEDLLLRELFIWARRPGASRVRVVACVLPRHRDARSGDERAPHPEERPRVRPRLCLQTDRAGGGTVYRFVTPLRCVGIRLGAVGLAAALQLDGTRTVRQIGDAISKARRARVHGRVECAVARLRAAGLLDERCDLKALGEQTFGVLRGRDSAQARAVRASLDGVTGNRSVRHLRDLLARIDAMDATWRFLERPPVYAVAPAGDDYVARVVAEAGDLLRRIGELLVAPGAGPVLIDALAERPGVPLTWPEVDLPYTLIRIPRPVLTRAVLAHELTHAVAMPRSRWLAEGVAVWMQRRVAPGWNASFEGPEADSASRPWPAGTLARLVAPPGPATAEAASVMDPASYEQAAGFVSYFVERYGVPTLRQLLRACAWGAGGDAIDRACAVTGGEPLRRVEERWRSRREGTGR